MSGARPWAAFFRGLNLGGRRLKMAELRSALSDAGLDGVATLLASGNAAFDLAGGVDDPRALEERLESHLEEALGFHTAVFVRPVRDLVAIAARDDLAAARKEGFNPHVIFLGDAVPPAAGEPTDGSGAGDPGGGSTERGGAATDVRTALAELEGDDDRFLVGEWEVVWLRRGGLSQAPFTTRQLEAALGDRPNTTRNLNTVERMVNEFGPADETVERGVDEAGPADGEEGS